MAQSLRSTAPKKACLQYFEQIIEKTRIIEMMIQKEAMNQSQSQLDMMSSKKLSLEKPSLEKLSLEKLWGKSPVSLLAILWVVFMVFFHICSNVQAAPVNQTLLHPTLLERAQRHDQSLVYYLSGAKTRSYNSNQVLSYQSSESSSYSASSASLADDIRLSESISPAHFWQSSPTVCQLADGSIIVGFEDQREGSQKIFLQKYTATGVAVGGNVLIAGRNDGFDLADPLLVATISNKFYLGYRDVAAGEIRVARLNTDLTIDLADFVANDASSGEYAGPFTIDARSNGEFAIAYESHLQGSTISLRRYNSSGVLVGATQTVNTDIGLASHWVPTLAFDENGGLGVAWEDYRSGVADIYLRRYDSAGVAQGPEINLVDVDAQSQGQFLPALVYSGIHGFVTSWSDTRSAWTVFMQRFSKQAGVGLVGANLPVSPLDSLTLYLDVDMAVSATGLISATYCGYGAVAFALAQKFDASLTQIGGPVVLSSEPTNQPVSPALVCGDMHALVWELQNAGDKDIRLVAADVNLAPITSSPVAVNDDLAGAVSDQPEVAVIDGTSIVTVFRDLRRDGGDIYLQASRIDGALSGANRLLNEDAASGVQSEPTIAANTQSYIVAWNDERFISGVNGSRIFVRYGIAGGAVTTNEILVSGDPTSAIAPKSTPSVAIASDGSALVAWLDSRNGTPQVFVRFLDASGAVSGSEFSISSVGSGNIALKPIVSVDNNNVFVIAWLSPAAFGGTTINVKRYNTSQTILGSFVFATDVAGVTISDFDSDVDNSGKIFLLWQGTNAVNHVSMYLTVFSNTGTKLAASIEIPDNLDAAPVEPSVSVDEFGNVLMAWVDSRGLERRIYTQNFNADITPAGGNQPLSLAAAPSMTAPSALAVRGRSWVSWVDARTEGPNVYIQGYVHFQTDVTDDDDVTLPSEFSLAQNYPNPFNPTTQIAFTLAQRTDLTLTIYNVLGQEIRALAQGAYPAGAHQILWDGADNSGSSVASGIYFYRLKTADYTQTRKMTLLK